MNAQLGIWQYFQHFPFIEPKYRISLGEGGTSLKKLNGIYLKCEFENPTGSVKDRSMAYQISHVYAQGIKKAVISSSGNAGISASAYCKKAGIDLTVFVSPQICRDKLQILNDSNCNIITSKTPNKDAFHFNRKTGAYNLRQSLDKNALFGYQTIAYELIETNSSIDAIFIPVSSGTTFVGIADGLEKIGRHIALQAVQTTKVHPVSEIFDTDFETSEKSLADGIVSRVSVRSETIIHKIKKTNGYAWTISDKQMQVMKRKLDSMNVVCSYEGAATLAALHKSIDKGFTYKNPVCLLTGSYYQCS